MTFLGSSATKDTYTGTVPNNNWGDGMLNALNLVKDDATQTPTPTTGPTISNVTITKIGTSNAEIAWSTDGLSTSYVRYWIASDPTGTTGLTGTTTMTEEHIVDLTGLHSNTNYSYQVISVDPYGNTSVYPPAGGSGLMTSKPGSSGCMCTQSGGTLNAGDLLPSVLVLIGWLVMVGLVKQKRVF